MIEAVVFCPCAPALVPEVGRGPRSELGDVRAAVAAAVTAAATAERTVVLVGPGPADAEYGPGATGTLAGFGVNVAISLAGDAAAADGPVLPPALSVGATFAPTATAARAIGPSITTSAPTPRLPDGPTTLVVLGDASARHSEKAPGYLDERSATYDADVRTALASGDPSRLAALDPQLGVDLLATGAPVWRAVAPLLTRRFAAQVLYAQAPFGVGYLVAVWT